MYRPDSIQFYLAQPVSMPDETTYREALQDEKSPLTRAVPGYEAEEAIIMLFEAALQKTFRRSDGCRCRQQPALPDRTPCRELFPFRASPKKRP